MKRYSYKVEFLPIEGEEGARQIDKAKGLPRNKLAILLTISQ